MMIDEAKLKEWEVSAKRKSGAHPLVMGDWFVELITAYRESQVEEGKLRNWNTRLQNEVLELQETLRGMETQNG